MYGSKVKLRFLFIAIFLTTLILTIFLILKSLEENVEINVTKINVTNKNLNLTLRPYMV